MSASAPYACGSCKSLALSLGSVRRWGETYERSTGAYLVQDGTMTWIHSAVVRAIRRAMVFDSRSHLVLQAIQNAVQLAGISLVVVKLLMPRESC